MFFLLLLQRVAASNDLMFIPPGNRPAIFHLCHKQIVVCASKQCTSEMGNAGRVMCGPIADLKLQDCVLWCQCYDKRRFVK